MKMEAFSRLASLAEQTELEKVRLLAFYHHKVNAKRQFGIGDAFAWFEELHFHAPNSSRLKSKLEKSQSFVRGSEQGTWKLHAADLDELQALFPGLLSKGEEVESTDCILPRPLYENTRGFVESLAKQINASYEYNIFDGCAVLMRRLLEVLLILSYEHCKIEGEILDGNGQYVPLEKIISNAKSNLTLKLSRDSKGTLEDFRSLGNFSAHKIYYNCRRADLQKVLMSYRATTEELLYKSGIRT